MSSLEVPVVQGWNIVGSISSPVPIASIGSIPGGIVTSPFYTYGTMGYEQASTINPGKGYWVKVTQAGSLVLSSSPSPMQKIRIVATGEMPPPPPGGVTAENKVEKPREFALGQNFPNPFNPTTTIGYSIAGVVGTLSRQTAGGDLRHATSLQVFDLLGRRVATLVNEPKEPGTYTVQWDASAVSSGVYFYRLQAGAFAATRKLLLLR